MKWMLCFQHMQQIGIQRVNKIDFYLQHYTKGRLISLRFKLRLVPLDLTLVYPKSPKANRQLLYYYNLHLKLKNLKILVALYFLKTPPTMPPRRKPSRAQLKPTIENFIIVIQQPHHYLDTIRGLFQGTPHSHSQSNLGNEEIDKNPFYQ